MNFNRRFRRCPQILSFQLAHFHHLRGKPRFMTTQNRDRFVWNHDLIDTLPPSFPKTSANVGNVTDTASVP